MLPTVGEYSVHAIVKVDGKVRPVLCMAMRPEGLFQCVVQSLVAFWRSRCWIGIQDTWVGRSAEHGVKQDASRLGLEIHYVIVAEATLTTFDHSTATLSLT